MLFCVRLRARATAESRPPPRVEDRDYSEQNLVLGTHTSDSDQNHLLIARVRLPLPDTEIDARKYDEEKGGAGDTHTARVRWWPRLNC